MMDNVVNFTRIFEEKYVAGPRLRNNIKSRDWKFGHVKRPPRSERERRRETRARTMARNK